MEKSNMNPEIKTQIDIIIAAYWKIRSELLKEPKIGLAIRFAYYGLKFGVWVIKFVR